MNCSKLSHLHHIILVMDRSGPRRNRSVYNYAALNKKGFQSLRPVRVKSRVKRKIGAPSPGSGNWRVELL